MVYNMKSLKTVRFQSSAAVTYKTYYGLLSLWKFIWYVPLGVLGAMCVWAKVLGHYVITYFLLSTLSS